MNINEIVNFLNEKEQTDDVGDMLYDQYGEHIELNVRQEGLPDKHRWYTLSDFVYEVVFKEKVLGYIKVLEVSNIHSESSDLSDISHTLMVKEVFPKEKTIIIYE